MIKGLFGIAALAGMAAAAPAGAVIVSGTLASGTAQLAGGVFVNLGNPGAFNVGSDDHNSSNVFGIDEKLFTLTTTLFTDIGGNIASGTIVRSHVIVFDPLRSQSAIGTVTFNAPILAIIRGGGKVAGSNFLGNPNVTYTTPPSFALEASDFVAFAGNTLSYSLVNGAASDTFRVITAAVPEPANWVMMLAGFGMVGFATRRRARMTAVSA